MANDALPQRLPGGTMVCPQCRKPSLMFIQDAQKFVCTNCGFEAASKHVK